MKLSLQSASIVPRAERIRDVAVQLFYHRGYHGTPIRVIARRLGLKTASLYYYFPSKQALLFAIMERTVDEITTGLERSLEGLGAPEARLRAAIRHHIHFHTIRRQEAFIHYSELRALTRRNYRRIVAKRDRYQQLFEKILDDGVLAGAFGIRDTKVAAYAVLTMCTAIASWFRPDGRLDPGAVADLYTDFVFQGVAGELSREKADGGLPITARRLARPLRSGGGHPALPGDGGPDLSRGKATGRRDG